MGELGKEIAAVLVIVLFLPLLLTLLIQGKQGVSFTGKEETEIYLPMMLAQAVDENLHMETLKAQAVLMRSNVTKALHEGDLSFSDLQKEYLENSRYWDKEFLLFYETLASACRETEGEMVFYQSKVCYCPYFAVSSGVTRDAFENFTESRYPYLMSVPSHRDEESEKYTTTVYYEKTDFTEKIKEFLLMQDNEADSGVSTSEESAVLQDDGPKVADVAGTGTEVIDVAGTGTEVIDPAGTGTEVIDPAGTGTEVIDSAGTGTEVIDPAGTGTEVIDSIGTDSVAEINIQILEQDGAGYVKWIQIGNQIVGGEVFREKLGLASACFSIEISENQVRIICKGIGHGFGFSQYGANAMAKEGKNYWELIKYYFQDITISKA